MIEQASLVIGEGNWAVKSDSLLGYKINNGKYYPREMSVVRATTGTRINEDGLVEEKNNNIARIDYSSGSAALLVEPQRTNLLTYSSSFDNAAWTKSQSSIIANSVTSPSGIQDADTLSVTSVNENFLRASSFSILGIIGAVYTTTIYVKKGTANFLRIRNLFVQDGGSFGNAWFNITNGTIATVESSQTAKIEDAGNGWYRCSLTGAVGTSNKFDFVDFALTDTDNTLYPSTAVNAYIWGAQLEAGSYVTSYIPTQGSTVTRNADVISKTGIADLIGQTEGTVFLEVDYQTLSGLNMFLSIRPNASNKIEVYRDGADIYAEVNSSTNFNIFQSKPIGTHKIAFAYKSGSSALYIDGTLVGQSTTAFTFSSTLSDLFVNQRSGGFYIEAVNYKSVALFKTRLTNAELATLTTI